MSVIWNGRFNKLQSVLSQDKDYAHHIIIDVQARGVLWQIRGQVVELQMGTVDCVEGQALGQHVMQ